MKLIIIHGPPAAGKLTVATELSRRTGFRLFHNHLSIDCVKPVLDFGSPAFWRLILLIRTGTIAEAAREGVSLIHTFCYEFGADDAAFEELIAAAEDNGGEVHTVLLQCEQGVLKQRIASDSRIRIGKLTDPESVGRIELQKPLPGRETLVIDTTRTSPGDSAERIIGHFGLERITSNEI